MLFEFTNEYSHSMIRCHYSLILGMNFGLVHAPNPGTSEWAQHSRSLGYVRGSLIQKQFWFLLRNIHNMQCVRRQPARTKSQESLYRAQMKTTARNNMKRLGRTMNKTIILCVIWELDLLYLSLQWHSVGYLKMCTVHWQAPRRKSRKLSYFINLPI